MRYPGRKGSSEFVISWGTVSVGLFLFIFTTFDVCGEERMIVEEVGSLENELKSFLSQIGLSYSVVVICCSVYTSYFVEELIPAQQTSLPKQTFSFVKFYKSTKGTSLFVCVKRPLTFEECLSLYQVISGFISHGKLLLVDSLLENDLDCPFPKEGADVLKINCESNVKDYLNVPLSDLTTLFDVRKQREATLYVVKVENYLGTTFITKEGTETLQKSFREAFCNWEEVFPRLEAFDADAFVKKCQSKTCKSMYS